eukprot:SAG11_NODE_4607_length_1815_cov_1.227717_2_plen_275_part_00
MMTLSVQPLSLVVVWFTVAAQGNHTFCTGSAMCPRWLWHNGTGIVLTVGNATLGPGALEVNVTNRTGDFASLTAHATQTAATSRRVEVFSVRLLHGTVGAEIGGSFGYEMLPSVPVESMNSMLDKTLQNVHVQNTGAVQAVSACSDTAPNQVQAVFWPTPSGGETVDASTNVAECIMGANATMRASLPSVVLLKRLNATAVSVTASGVDTGGAIVITLDGFSMRCGRGAAGASAGEDRRRATPRAHTRLSTTVTLALPTEANLIGKSATVVCEV